MLAALLCVALIGSIAMPVGAEEEKFPCQGGDLPVDVPSCSYSLGDLNLDRQIDAVDALQALLYSVEKITLNPEEISLADMNSDDAIDAEDALMILQKAVGR